MIGPNRATREMVSGEFVKVPVAAGAGRKVREATVVTCSALSGAALGLGVSIIFLPAGVALAALALAVGAAGFAVACVLSRLGRPRG